MNEEIKLLNAKAAGYAQLLEKTRQETAKVVVGQREITDKLLIALLAEGHVLLEGVPGLAKTLIMNTLANCVDASFVRLQFTPDLLPADILGTKIYESREGTFKTIKGPIFNNFVLCDEINRAPPKVQSALLEAMQEKQVSIQGETHQIKKPFFVMATQNPIEHEGTYKLPEAQVDRFMLKLNITYPEKEDEIAIIERFTEPEKEETTKTLSTKQLTEMQEFTRKIYADKKIREYVAEIVDATRHPAKYGVEAEGHIEYGASPRASIWLVLAGKANALLNGRGYILPEDIKELAHDVLRHRVLLTFEAEAEGITSDQIIDKILSKVRVP